MLELSVSCHVRSHCTCHLLNLFYFRLYASPSNVVQAQGLAAEFLCQHPTDSGTMQWLINGTLFRYVSNDAFIRIESRGNSTKALIIRALPQYNGTEVVCVLYIVEPNGTLTVDRSTLVTLIIQGINYCINNLNMVAILILDFW